jgi:hypothetical protein
MASLSTSATPLGAWLRGLSARAHRNVVVVALANRLARVVLAVLHGGCGFEARRTAA